MPKTRQVEEALQSGQRFGDGTSYIRRITCPVELETLFEDILRMITQRRLDEPKQGRWFVVVTQIEEKVVKVGRKNVPIEGPPLEYVVVAQLLQGANELVVHVG